MPSPVANSITPPSGKVGHTAVIHGTDLQGGSIEVLFGSVTGVDPHNAGNSGKVVKVKVPNKAGPGDPDGVTVTVKVDGTAAAYPNGALTFTYQIPEPAPDITAYAPQFVNAGEPVSVTFSGVNFTANNRTPQKCSAVGADPKESTSVSAVTDSSMTFAFPGFAAGGDYEFVVLFSDGAGDSIVAPDFVLSPTPDPVITGFNPASNTATSISTLTALGANFKAGGRSVQSVHLVSPSGIPIAGQVTASAVTDTSIPAAFSPAVANAGIYTYRVRFSDGLEAVTPYQIKSSR